MPVTKFAISVPAETMHQVDRAAKRLGMTRSRYISTVLARVAEQQKNRSISERVDRVLASLGEQDLGAVELFARARRPEGTEW